MNHTPRISLLSPPLREEINHRLLNGDPDHLILKWLHISGEVRALIQQKFPHDAFNSRDLDEWRATAFAEWKRRREFTHAAQKPAQLAASEPKTSARQVADHLAEVLAGLYARLMHKWDGDATPEFTARLRALSHLCRDICALRKSEHQAAQLKLAEAEVALRQKQSEAEAEVAFLKRLDEPGMRNRIVNYYYDAIAHKHGPKTRDASPKTPSQSSPIKPNQAQSGVGTARPQGKSSPAPSQPASPAPSSKTPDPKPQTPDPRRQTPDARPQSLKPKAQSGSIRPNQTKSRDSKVTCNVLPGDPGYVEVDAPDIYSTPNPAIAARKRQKEEPIVSGFVSPVSYFAADNRNDVHF